MSPVIAVMSRGARKRSPDKAHEVSMASAWSLQQGEVVTLALANRSRHASPSPVSTRRVLSNSRLLLELQKNVKALVKTRDFA